MSENKIGDRGARALGATLEACAAKGSRVASLDVSACGIGKGGGRALAAAAGAIPGSAARTEPWCPRTRPA